MTAKEKARELVEKIKTGLWRDRAVSIYSEDAIYCALIMVDEIINSSPSLPILSDNGTFGSDIEESTKFWLEVKQEIENL